MLPVASTAGASLIVGKFISGKSEQNAVKTMVVTDGEGRVL
ncbi:hypothetical protein [Streptomyces sp. NPDC055060]